MASRAYKPDYRDLDDAAPVDADLVMAASMERIPVDVSRIAHELGITVEYTNDLPSSVSGRIRRCPTSSSGFCIDINARQAPARQRFTLAHEIAHYMLHRDLIGDGVTDDAMYRSALDSYYERQANRYAGDLLIPARALRRAVAEGQTAQELSVRFRVSAEALRIRMEQLGLRP